MITKTWSVSICDDVKAESKVEAPNAFTEKPLIKEGNTTPAGIALVKKSLLFISIEIQKGSWYISTY